LTRKGEDALWQQVFMAQPARRREFEPVGRGASNQASQEATRALAAQHGLNPKTVAKGRTRKATADRPMGPRRRRSTVLAEAEEGAKRRFAPSSSSDGARSCRPTTCSAACARLEAPLPTPKLTRSALHRRLRRHGISRLPKAEGEARRGRFAETVDRAAIDRLHPRGPLRAALGRGQAAPSKAPPSSLAISRSKRLIRQQRCGRQQPAEATA
jgi:hypothetical protein